MTLAITLPSSRLGSAGCTDSSGRQSGVAALLCVSLVIGVPGHFLLILLQIDSACLLPVFQLGFRVFLADLEMFLLPGVFVEGSFPQFVICPLVLFVDVFRFTDVFNFVLCN